MTTLPGFAATALHGRDEERQRLQGALERIRATGVTEVVMVKGRAGVGKSTLAHWLVRRAQAGGCAVGEGKCDQLNAEIPFAAVADVVRMLTLDALGGEGTALNALSARWRDLLSGHGNSITELVPEAVHVLGDSGPPLSLLTPQGQDRVGRALVRTLEAFAQPGQPAVVFLDDLQWADEASLLFLRTFIVNPPANVLFIGAYRDDGGAFAQWYFQAKHANRRAGAHFTELAIAPLSIPALRDIVAESLARSGADVDGLAAVLHEKSGGNPYFAQQLLQSWVDDGVLAFAGGTWRWSAEALALSRHAEHVVDLIVGRMTRLPDTRRRVLERLSCIGMQCDGGLLAHVCNLAPGVFAEAVDGLAAASLLVRRGDACAFQHDRVLEAAYALIGPEAKSAAHAHVARRMMTYRGDQATALAYEIGNQIEKVAPADVLDDEKPGFVRILLAAARRAQRASVAGRAYECHRTAASMMDASWWDTDFALAYEAALIECECLVAKAELALAAERINAILPRVPPGAARAPLHGLDAVLHTLRSDYGAAIDASTAGLDTLGIRLRRDPSPAGMRAACDTVMEALGGRRVAELVHLPVCEDGATKTAMALLATLVSSFFTDDDIRFTHLAKLVELTLRHGVTPDSPYGLAWFGVLIASTYDRYEDGYAFGRVALDIVDRHGFESARIGTLVALDQVAVWTQPLETALDYVQQASIRGSQSGDVGMACYACNHIVSDMLAMGAPLALVDEAAEYGIGLTRSIGYVDIELLIEAQRDFVTIMREGFPAGGQDAWTGACTARAAAATSLPTKFWAALHAGMSAVFLQEWALAVDFLARSMALVAAVPAHINVADCHLFHALAVSRSGAAAPDAVAALLASECARFALWTRHNARTFSGKLHLLQGELARHEGHDLKALGHFESALRAAGAAGFVHEEALAHELAAMLCRGHALDVAASQHARLAKAAYTRWGAAYKAAAIAASGADPGADAVGEHDDAALRFGLKAAGALSQEAVKERLVETMFSDLLAHASAQYGVLVRVTDGVPMIEASGRMTEQGVATSVAAVEPNPGILPMRLLNTVLRTRQSVIVHDALDDTLPIRVQRERAGALRSVLCLPLLRGGELVGLLYLENDRAPGVFNPARVQHLELMASQIAIALGFARLYEQLIAANGARTEAERHLHLARAELVRNVHVTVLASLAASIAHEINQPLGAVVTSAEAALRWLDREAPDIGRAQAGLERIRKDALRAADIIRALRALAAKHTAGLEEIRIADVIAGVVDMSADEFAAHGIDVGLDLDPGVTVAGDRVQLQQVVLNLLNNAIEAMAGNDDAGRTLHVAMRLAGARLQVVVEDTGPGIAGPAMERVFDPFYTTKPGGLGMGLSICLGIAEAHGGTLTAANRAGGGMSFVLEMPARVLIPR